MTDLFAQNSANWDAANQWNTAANGSGIYQTPVSGDRCMANGKTVAINISVNLGGDGSVTNAANGGTAGGGFTLSDGVTLTANVVGAGTSACVTYSGASPNSAGLVGNISATWTVAVQNTSSGTLNITGHVTGSTSFNSNCVYNSSSGTINITGNVSGGPNNNSLGCNNNSVGTISITGTVTGGSVSSESYPPAGVKNSSAGTVSVTGNVVGGSVSLAYGAWNNSSGAINITGNATGGSGGNNIQIYGAYNASSGSISLSGIATGMGNNSGGFVNLGVGLCFGGTGARVSSAGCPGALGRIHWPSPVGADFYMEQKNTNNDTLRFYQKNSSDYPLAADVRYGTAFRTGDTGTLRVPSPDSVALNVLTDDTVGRAVFSPTLTASIGSAPYEMLLLDTDVLTNQDVSSPLLVYTYTASSTVALIFEVAASGLAGDGTYLAATTKQVGGTGPAFQSKTDSVLLGVGTDTALFTTTVVPAESGDVVKVYLQGQVGDTAVGVTVKVYDVSVNKEGYALTEEYNAAKHASSQSSIDALHDFDPVNDTVAHVTLVDTTTDLTNSPDLSIVTDAIAALHDFDPVNDTVAHVTLVDTVTTLTNSPDVPTEAEIADAVRVELAPELASITAIKAKTDNLPSRPAAVGSEMTLTSAYDAAKTAATQASVNAIPTGDPMAAPMGDYEEGTAGYEIHELYEQVTAVLPDYPSITVPAPPTAEQSTAWIRCLSQAGAPEAGVTITVRLVSVDAGVDAYDMAPASGTSDASGLATITIPRGAQCLFEARRGGTGRWVRFRGANAPTVLLPSVLGSP